MEGLYTFGRKVEVFLPIEFRPAQRKVKLMAGEERSELLAIFQSPQTTLLPEGRPGTL
jgi:hypothetical protein